ncbi:MAG: glycosyltransferase family 2 protein [Abditibacteriales bacterium]|nr:glycosyltransferase family 2 protein [Abditibacteriales bacterium]MDW8366896.1 glycosyltransferase family 2 protein [Abditibacteriales bacterium]
MVSVIIPAYNEAERIADTVRAVQTIPQVDEIIVVDDGSSDNTAEAAALGGVRVIRLPQNCGKGEALTAGVAVARGDVLMFLDADLGETAQHAGALLEPVLKGDVDMTIAVLPPAQRKGGAGFVLRAAREGIKRATGFEPTAPLSGQRALTRALMDRIGKIESGFGVEVALTIDALRAGARVGEVPVPFRHRETGRDWRGVLHRAKQWWHVRRALKKRK